MDAARFASFRTLLFLFLNALGAGLLASILLVPALSYVRERQAEGARQAATVERITDRMREVARMLAIDPEQAEAAYRRFVQGDSRSLVEADLLARVQRVASDSGVTLRTVTTLPSWEYEGLLFAGARLEFLASTVSVAELLSAMENGASFFVIRRARLWTSTDSEHAQDLINVDVDLYGAMRGQKE